MRSSSRAAHTLAAGTPRSMVMPLKGSRCFQPAGGSAISQSRMAGFSTLRARGLGDEAGCVPRTPAPKLEPGRGGKDGDARDAGGNLFRIRLPVADVAKPARIQMKH